ncbi:hypothetical protein L1049_019496 [Liquidambar formosana]|uniref:Uncharacterized protein n=1 Tax=Liquidambar formosana TaxID=63359 RepID=A0AAP0X998_LIQFO
MNDDKVIRRGRVLVDNEATLVEAGELVGAVERGVILHEEIAGGLVELIKGEKLGRRNDGERAVFKFIHSAVIDILTPHLMYETCMEIVFWLAWMQNCAFQPVVYLDMGFEQCYDEVFKTGNSLHFSQNIFSL